MRSHSAPPRLRLSHSNSTPTTLQLLLPLLNLVSLAMATRVKNKVAVMAVAGAAVAALPAITTRARPALSRPPGFPSITLRLGPSTYTPVLLGRGGIATIPSSAAAGSHRCAWPDHGRPSLHATPSADLGFVADVCHPAAADHISIPDTLAWLVVAGQLLQHDDAPDATLT
jgi:hypothetical protein